MNLFYSLFDWIQQKGPSHPKHYYHYNNHHHYVGSINHSIVVLIIHYIIVYIVTMFCHDMLVHIFVSTTRNSSGCEMKDDVVIVVYDTTTAVQPIITDTCFEVNGNAALYNNEDESCHNNNMNNGTTTATTTINNNNEKQIMFLAYLLLLYSIWLLLWRLWCCSCTTKLTTTTKANSSTSKSTTNTNNSTKNIKLITTTTTVPIADKTTTTTKKKMNRSYDPANITSAILYEYCWLCNVTLSLGGYVGLIQCKPYILWSYCVVVGIDQLLWYIDISIALLTRGTLFPIGVAKYLMWDHNTNWYQRITCTHHLWTIPTLLYGVHLLEHNNQSSTIYQNNNDTKASLSHEEQNSIVIIIILSFIIMATNVLLSRFMIPSHLSIPLISMDDENENKILTKSTLVSTSSSSTSPPAPRKSLVNLLPMCGTTHGNETITTTIPNVATIGTKPNTTTTSDTNNVNTTATSKSTTAVVVVGAIRYLNVNLSYELWKDITFSFLQINYDEPNVRTYMIRLFLRWHLFNMIIYYILYHMYQFCF